MNEVKFVMRFHDSLNPTEQKSRRSALPATALLALTMLSASGFAALPAARAEGGWVRGTAFDTITIGAEADGTPLQVCRANDGSPPSPIPGKTRHDWTDCAFAVGSVEKRSTSYETLRPVWLTPAEAQRSKPKGSGGALGEVGSSIHDAVNGVSPGASEAGKTLGVDSDGRTPLYVCRGAHAGGLHLGKKLAGVDGCAIPYGGSEVWLKDYQILVSVGGLKIELLPVSSVPENAVVGGYETTGTPLYPCIGAWQGGRHPGKTRRDWSTCSISFGGKEVHVTSYTVIVAQLITEDMDAKVFPICNVGLEAPDQRLGVCVANLPQGRQVGKYNVKSRACTVSYGGGTIQVFSNYQTARCPIAEAIRSGS